jgi:hypothetical protein
MVLRIRRSKRKLHEFLKLRLMYDPYSPTAEEDFNRLRTELEKIDVVGMLVRELRKSRVDEVLVRQLVKSIRYLSPASRDAAVETLISPDEPERNRRGNLDALYPLFPTVALVIRALLPELSETLRTRIFEVLRSQIESKSYIFQVPANLCFALRLLAHDPSEESDTLIAQLYDEQVQMMVRRDLILCLAKRGVDYQIADIIRRFAVLSPWEKRALIPASYILGDEGLHWRNRVKQELSFVDREFMAWVGTKNSGRLWEIPL